VNTRRVIVIYTVGGSGDNPACFHAGLNGIFEKWCLVMDSEHPLLEVAAVFTRLGFTAFGGPAVHIGMMEDEVVTRRGWLGRQHFLDLVSAINFIPGPNSTELAIALGAVRAGFAGLVVAGTCFITPAVLIILPLAWAYVKFGRTPSIQPIMHGIGAAVLAVVIVAMWRFGKTGIRNWFTIAVATGALIMELAMLKWLPGVTPEVPILATAAIAGFLKSWKPWQSGSTLMVIPLGPFLANPELWRMVLAFLKIGATLFGSGYVLLSYLQSGFIDSHGWLTRQQVLDAIAVGQFTPGPVLTTSTFIGYLLGATRFKGGVVGGIAGGLLATLAIFLPSFLFTALLGRMLNRLRENPTARGSLEAMNAAVVSLIAVTTFRLAMSALNDPLNITIAIISVIALTVWKVNSTWLILLAAALRFVIG
jgi:chromate transporter